MLGTTFRTILLGKIKERRLAAQQVLGLNLEHSALTTMMSLQKPSLFFLQQIEKFVQQNEKFVDELNFGKYTFTTLSQTNVRQYIKRNKTVLKVHFFCKMSSLQISSIGSSLQQKKKQSHIQRKNFFQDRLAPCYSWHQVAHCEQTGLEEQAMFSPFPSPRQAIGIACQRLLFEASRLGASLAEVFTCTKSHLTPSCPEVTYNFVIMSNG